MGYIGATPSNNFINTDVQRITGSTNNYIDLDHSISSLDSVIVYVNNVRQESTNLTFTSASRITLGDTLTASDVCEVIFLGKAVATQTPDNGTITLDMLSASGTKSSSTFLRGDNTFATVSSTTINNNADNRVITGSGTANTLEGEARLTFNSGDVLQQEASGSTTEYRQTADGGGTYWTSLIGSASDVKLFTRTASPLIFGCNNTEHMRVANDGGIFLNTTTRTGASNVLSVLGNSSDDVMHVRTPTTNGAVNGIRLSDGDGSDCGEIVINTGGNTASYNTSSDYRLKENVSYDFDATSRLKQLKPSRFNWISKPDTTVDGFLAHEVSSIVPEAINGTKDATKTVTNAVISIRNSLIADGVTEAEWEQGKIDGIYPNNSTWSASKAIPNYQSIDQAKLVPLFTKALQEAITKIETLEARVQTLEEA